MNPSLGRISTRWRAQDEELMDDANCCNERLVREIGI